VSLLPTHLNEPLNPHLLLRQQHRPQIQIPQVMTTKKYQSTTGLQLWPKSGRRSKTRNSALFLKRPSSDGQNKRSRRSAKLSSKLYISEKSYKVMQEHLGEEGTGFKSFTLSWLVLPVIDEHNIFRQARVRDLRLGFHSLSRGRALGLYGRINHSLTFKGDLVQAEKEVNWHYKERRRHGVQSTRRSFARSTT
jgi:hypothetical protein